VTAPTVAGADLSRGQPVIAGQRVDERGLAGAGRPDEHERPAGTDPAAHPLEALAIGGADREHVDPEGHRLGRLHGGVDVGAEVGLGEHDDGHGTAVPCEHQLTLEPAAVHRPVEPVHQQDVVDVGGEGLGAGGPAGGAPGERRAAGHDVGDQLGIGGDDHPVADGDRFADVGSIGAAGGGDTAAAAIDAGDAADEMVKR
jgi:hypothetical protein